MVAIPNEFADLLEHKKAFAMLSTIMPDGSPQVTPVWFDHVGGGLRINSAKGRVKTRNMSEGAKVAIAIVDPDNPYRYLQIRGRVARVSEKGADEHINRLSKKYLDQDKYPYARPGEVRVIFDIEPLAVQGMG